MSEKAYEGDDLYTVEGVRVSNVGVDHSCDTIMEMRASGLDLEPIRVIMPGDRGTVCVEMGNERLHLDYRELDSLVAMLQTFHRLMRKQAVQAGE